MEHPIWRKPAICKQCFFQNKPVEEWMKKFIALLTKKKKKWLLSECENGNFFVFYAMHVKKLEQFFFHTWLLTCLKKDTSVLLKALNIWTS